MWKLFWWGGGLSLFFGAVIIWVAATSTFLYRHPRLPELRVVIDKRTGSPVIEGLSNPAKPLLLASTAGLPRAEVARRDYDFGEMDPESSGEHSFQIKNVGRAPLELKVGPTTCKCTVSGLSNNKLLPGELGFVKMEWNTGRKHLLFAQSALVYSNDPLLKEIELTVSGKIRMRAGLEPSEISMSATEPDKPITAEVLVYSQLWPEIKVAAVTGKLPGLKWTAERVEPAATAGLEARCVQKLALEFLQPVSKGSFEDSLQIEVRPVEGEDKPQYLDLAVSGSVMRRFAIYGPAIDNTGLIDLGSVPQGVGKKIALLCKVRDSQTDLGQPKIKMDPPLLNVQFTPRVEGQASGLYDLVIELPADLPTCQYLATPVGRLEIITDHPRIGTVELMVSFAVLPQ